MPRIPSAWDDSGGTVTDLLGLVSASAAEYADRPYLVPAEPGDREVSFADVATFAKGCAALLDERGVPQGGRVAVVMHNSSLTALLFIGIIAARRVLVPLNPRSGAAELSARLAHAQPALVLGSASVAAQVTGDFPMITIENGGAFVARVLAAGEARTGDLTPNLDDGSSDAEIVYTSGSTGTAKGVVLSHRALLANSAAMAGWAKADQDDVYLNVVPLFHAGGQGFPTLTPLWTGGRSVCVRPETALVRFWNYVDRFSPTWVLVVNAYLASLTERPERPVSSRLKGVLSGGSALGPELIHRFEDTFGIPVYQVYGMTEMTSLTTVEPRDRKPGDRRTAGPPVPFARVRIASPDGHDVPANGNGEVLLSGPAIFTRYENAPELTAQRLDHGWVRSGDLGNLDARGELSIVDRIDSLVIVNGENVYPAEIENVVPHLEGVEDAVAVGLPHPVTGGELVLVYTLLPDAVANDDAWRAKLLEFLAPVKVPRRFIMLKEIGTDSFPRTPLGKIQRAEVQRLALERQA